MPVSRHCEKNYTAVAPKYLYSWGTPSNSNINSFTPPFPMRFELWGPTHTPSGMMRATLDIPPYDVGSLSSRPRASFHHFAPAAFFVAYRSPVSEQPNN